MAGRVVYGAPYRRALALASWALPRWRYLRGRILLAGHDPESFDARDILDVAEAVLVDSFVFGHTAIDEVVHRLTGALEEVVPDRTTWGTLAHQREAAVMAETMFAAASRPRKPRPSTL